MTTEINAKRQIYQIVESLPIEQLPELLRLIRQSFQHIESGPAANAAPIYQIHKYAVDTGIPDLAAKHDHYLYGTSKHDA